LPDSRRTQRRLIDARLVSRVVAHLAVIGLVASTAALGLAATRGSAAADGSAEAALFLVSPVRGANESHYAPLTAARITLDPQAARDAPEPELQAVRMPVETAAPKPTPAPIAADATPLPAPPNAPSVGSAQQSFGVGPAASVLGTGVATGSLAWPVPSGSISQGFHADHLAVDIAAYGGATVVAADGGVVTSAGWRDNGGGLVIEIDHGNGIVTLYNHLGGLWVSPGQAVARGQAIAGVGCSGICTGPHVHFEVMVNGVISNPLRYL
jgi:murein DD-endopeptidase MepM/ murein hydrolase activator NlpD